MNREGVARRRGSSSLSVVSRRSEFEAGYKPAWRLHSPVKGSGLRGTWKVRGTPADGGGYLEALDAQCPVPKDQRPVQELKQLKEDLTLSWALLPLPSYLFRILGTWLAVAALIGVPVASYSYNFQTQALQVYLSAAASALVVVTALVLRMFLGWQYVDDRLSSATVQYEETGWYDGQLWVKTEAILSRDRLMSRYQVGPVLGRIRATLLACGGSIITASAVLQLILPAPSLPLLAIPPPDVPLESGVRGQYTKYNEDTHLMSHQVFLSYTSQLDPEDVARTYEPWAFEDEDMFDNEDAEQFKNAMERIKGTLEPKPKP